MTNKEALITVSKSCKALAMEFGFSKICDTDKKALNILKELVDKATPKKFNHITEGSVYCPNCDKMLDKMYSRHYKYCPECGQKLDWGDDS